MGADFDIFNPTVTKVIKGIEGKMILVHSKERKVGKTYQATKMPKPYYLRFEQGVNAIDGLPYAPLTSWSDFKKVNKQLTNPKTLDEAKKRYETIIIDTVDVAIKWCEQYICATQGVNRLNDGNSGYGLWKEYENEWFREINKLTNAGYTLYFISHSEERTCHDIVTGEEYTQLVPKGDKRTIDLILDLVDFIGYVKSNGFDEEGNEIPSSIYFTNTKEFQAGSRFTKMAKVVSPFTAENLQKAIIDAVEAEEEETGSAGVTLAEAREIEKSVKKTWEYEELFAEIKRVGGLLFPNYRAEVEDIMQEVLNQTTFEGITKKQMPQLEVMLDEFMTLAEDKGVELG